MRDNLRVVFRGVLFGISMGILYAKVKVCVMRKIILVLVPIFMFIGFAGCKQATAELEATLWTPYSQYDAPEVVYKFEADGLVFMRTGGAQTMGNWTNQNGTVTLTLGDNTYLGEIRGSLIVFDEGELTIRKFE